MDALTTRFIAKIKVIDGCWLWQASQRNSYGAFWYKGRHWRASRFSYFLFYKDLKDDFIVCHTCDVKLCVNPDHLFQGTQSDNIKDCVRKGRHVGRLGTRKYSSSTVRQVKFLLRQGYSHRKIVKITGVGIYTISMIRNNYRKKL